jgi:hypothetical protein
VGPVVLVIVGLAVVLATVLAGIGQVLGARVRAVTAADAAALAAVAVTFRPFGSDGDPAAEAARFAESHGAELVSCDCEVDPTYEPRIVEVHVAVEVDVVGLGPRRVTADSRAVMEPLRLLVP